MSQNLTTKKSTLPVLIFIVSMYSFATSQLCTVGDDEVVFLVYHFSVGFTLLFFGG